MDKEKKLLIIIAALIVIIGLGTYGGVHFTSQTAFCNSCHEMNTAFAGWQSGTHQELHCYECHTDPGLINEAKIKLNGLKEVYIHLTQDVNMEEVVADIPADRCIRCHDLTNKEKYDERVVNYHKTHQGFGFEDCLTCHRPVGHTGNTFDGFKNKDCAKCHTAPAKDQKPAAQTSATTPAATNPSTTTDSSASGSTGSSTSGSTSSSTSGATKPSTSTPTNTSTSKPTLNLGHDLGSTYANSCTTCHAGGAMLSKKPSHSIDGSTGDCSTCHTLKPKA